MPCEYSERLCFVPETLEAQVGISFWFAMYWWTLAGECGIIRMKEL